MMVYHAPHGFIFATCQADEPVTSGDEAVLPWFQDLDNNYLSSGSWLRALCPQTVVQGQQKLIV
jgi:hypothetical protein